MGQLMPVARSGYCPSLRETAMYGMPQARQEMALAGLKKTPDQKPGILDKRVGRALGSGQANDFTHSTAAKAGLQAWAHMSREEL